MAKNVGWYGRSGVDPVRSGGSGSGRPAAALRGLWRDGGRPPFLMPRGGLLFWVLVSILLSVVLTVLLNLLLLF